MPYHKTWRRGLIATAAALTLAVSACGTPEPSTGSGTPEGKRGGTLNLLAQSDLEHLDPARNYVSSQLQLEVLYAPTLTSYVNKPGAAGSVIGADAATDTGTHNADATVWNFTIRKNLKWEDGRTVTCEDFRYGINRSFSPIITNGPQYQKQYLKGGETYQGVYDDPKGISSVTCKGDVLTFQLVRSVADFNYTVSLGIFAAVRADKDTKTKYDLQPFSYGPYKIQKHVRDQSLVLVRNTYWDQSLDTIRRNLPDVLNFEFGQDPGVINDRLIADRGADQQAIPYANTQVTAAQAPQVFNTPAVKKRVVTGYSGYVWYVAINTRKIGDLDCRKAFQYAMDKQTYLTAIGGPQFGDFATTATAPTLRSYKKIDPWGLANKPQGDPAMARTFLGQAKTCPRTVKLDYSQSPTGDKIAASIKDSLARIGVTVTPVPINRKAFYTTTGKSDSEDELVYTSWGADWPSGSAVIAPLFDGRQITKEGNQVYTLMNDPKINQAIDAAGAVADSDKAQPLWAAIDEQVQLTSATIPLRYDKSVYVVGSKVTGAYLNPNFGDVSLLNVGVAQ
ncbi:ABC transporter substrate-binding protein [Fodinicola feengrottensis]|uniref:ABC transporter substrate-binding protein n=2 Tax=Fodinicola feengrottensis TaxID=435914 RepID=A0ABN2GPB2_9ACTN